MLIPAAEPPQDAEDLYRLIVRLEALAASDPAKAPTCRELLAKLASQLADPALTSVPARRPRPAA
jgi:hypothetical protein